MQHKREWFWLPPMCVSIYTSCKTEACLFQKLPSVLLIAESVSSGALQAASKNWPPNSEGPSPSMNQDHLNWPPEGAQDLDQSRQSLNLGDAPPDDDSLLAAELQILLDHLDSIEKDNGLFDCEASSV